MITKRCLLSAGLLEEVSASANRVGAIFSWRPFNRSARVYNFEGAATEGLAPVDTLSFETGFEGEAFLRANWRDKDLGSGYSH